MQFHFCDCCGRRVADADLRHGEGVQQGDVVVCAVCMDNGDGRMLLESLARERPESEDDLVEVGLPEELTPAHGIPLGIDEPLAAREPLDPAASLLSAAGGFGALVAQPPAVDQSVPPAERENFGQSESAAFDAPSEDPWEGVDPTAETGPTPTIAGASADDVHQDDEENDDVARRGGSRSGGSSGSGRRGGGGSRSGPSRDDRRPSSRSDRRDDGRRSSGRQERASNRGSTRQPTRGKKNNNAMVYGFTAVSVLLIIIMGVAMMSGGTKPPTTAPIVQGISNPGLEKQISAAISSAASAIKADNLGQVNAAIGKIRDCQRAYGTFMDKHGGSNPEMIAWTKRARYNDMQALFRSLTDAQTKLEARR